MKILRTVSLESNFTDTEKRLYCDLHYYKRLVAKLMNISV